MPRKPSKARLARDAKFKASIEAFLIEKGADYSPRFGDWHIATVSGPMKVSINTEGELYTLFCRFTGKGAHEKFNWLSINPYSGKYNFHMTAPDDNDGLRHVIDQARGHIERVL